MEKYKPTLLIIAGVVVALITSYITYGWLQKKAEAGSEKLAKTQNVAVAALDIPVGTELKKDMVKFTPYLSETLPDGFFTEMSKLEGRVIISSIKEKEPIFETSLAPVGIEGGGVAAVINPNKRAMAVKVDKVIGISGFIAPGHKVDVLVTLDDKKSNPITKTVLQNVLVLATGTKIEKNSKNKPIEVDVITLEVTPTEAEKLALASTEGKIQFALRNFRDTEDVYTRGTTKSTLLSSYNMQKEPEVKTENKSVRRVYIPQIERHTVEVIKGTQVNKVTY